MDHCTLPTSLDNISLNHEHLFLLLSPLTFCVPGILVFLLPFLVAFTLYFRLKQAAPVWESRGRASAQRRLAAWFRCRSVKSDHRGIPRARERAVESIGSRHVEKVAQNMIVSFFYYFVVLVVVYDDGCRLLPTKGTPIKLVMNHQYVVRAGH